MERQKIYMPYMTARINLRLSLLILLFSVPIALPDCVDLINVYVENCRTCRKSRSNESLKIIFPIGRSTTY